MATFLVILAVVIIGSIVSRGLTGGGTGGRLISRHDHVYAEVPPGVIPPRALEAPTRKATAADTGVVVAVRFEPPQGVRPEEVGTLTQAKMASTDIAAGMVALAVDGFIHLRRVEPQGHGLPGSPRPQWLVTLRRQATEQEVGTHRAVLLQALAALGRPATLTELKPAISEALPRLRADMDNDPQHHA